MKKAIFLTITLSVLLVAVAIGKDKKKAIKTVVVTATNLHARTGPNTNQYTLGLYPRDTILPVYEEKNGWYKTKCPADTKIFISLKYIKVKGADGVILGDNVNGRSRPDEQSVVCFKFNRKTKVTVKGMQGKWIQIAPPAEAYAWVSGNAKFVKVLKGNIDDLIVKDDMKANNNDIEVRDDTSDPKEVSNENSIKSEAEILLEKQQAKKDEIQKNADEEIKIILDTTKNKMKKGWVKRLGKVIGRKATHALYLTEGQPLFHLISENPKIKIEDYANMFVGILGQDLGKEKRSKVKLISVSKIKVFKAKEPQIKLTNDKSKK
ncbi:MAG: hypothetical protein COA79_24470 [Planctomycetota bacterium]|nr:MAG: hypothetical protein COA79_24470 [Planctomycetota bacterium]